LKNKSQKNCLAEEVVVATTRPETLFGDTAVAINPSDPKYKKLHGKFVVNPLTDEKLPIILDESVDSNFQTGSKIFIFYFFTNQSF
jgi:valyl-tRNA synthetase